MMSETMDGLYGDVILTRVAIDDGFHMSQKRLRDL